MAEITREGFIQAVRDAVTERGEDWVYPQDRHDARWWARRSTVKEDYICRYAQPDGTPACLFGLALSKLGVDIEEFGGESLGISDLLGRLTDPSLLGSDLIRAAEGAQEAQDNGLSWGVALQEFEEALY